MSAAAVEHAATFSWARTVDALLASYGRAISDYRARQRSGRDGAAQRAAVHDPAGGAGMSTAQDVIEQALQGERPGLQPP